MKRLENKVAVVYGDGAVGGAVARAFAAEGARVFLTGRTAAKLDAIAKDVNGAGGQIETAQVDALNESEVEAHLSQVVSSAGGIDISFNAIGISLRGIHGIPLTEISLDRFMEPVNVYIKSHFITGRAAARRMTKQSSGVLLMHTPNAGRNSPPFVGGCVPAWAALEAFCRSLSVECGPFGVRAVCLLTTAIPETPLIEEVWDIHSRAHGMSFEEFRVASESMTHTKKLTTLASLSAAAVFAASDDGIALSGASLNLTAGMIPS